MKTVAVYNMKGGVGKTTTAVNLAYFAAASGRRTLLWDLDPQAASSFAFRVRPNVPGFGKRSLGDGQALAAAIKATDYQDLDLLPADFAYRKFERFLGCHDEPDRVIGTLLDTMACDYDLVILDCPAGFSLLTEGVFAAADTILVPTIPTVLSLRMVARLIKCADPSDAPARLVAFFSMVDRRKTLHRRAVEWASEHPKVFLNGHVPYASVVEQMAARRLPLATFPRDPATMAFAAIWAEVESGLSDDDAGALKASERLFRMLDAVNALIAYLEPAETPAPQAPAPHPTSGATFVHRFDTERRDLERSGHSLELREGDGSFYVVASPEKAILLRDASAQSQVQIDNSWALQILTEELSPLAALERRLGHPGPRTVQELRRIAGSRKLRRVDTGIARPTLPSRGIMN